MIGFSWAKRWVWEKERSSGVLGLNNRKDEVAIYLDGEHLGEMGLGVEVKC